MACRRHSQASTDTKKSHDADQKTEPNNFRQTLFPRAIKKRCHNPEQHGCDYQSKGWTK